MDQDLRAQIAADHAKSEEMTRGDGFRMLKSITSSTRSMSPPRRRSTLDNSRHTPPLSPVSPKRERSSIGFLSDLSFLNDIFHFNPKDGDSAEKEAQEADMRALQEHLVANRGKFITNATLRYEAARFLEERRKQRAAKAAESGKSNNDTNIHNIHKSKEKNKSKKSRSRSSSRTRKSSKVGKNVNLHDSFKSDRVDEAEKAPSTPKKKKAIFTMPTTPTDRGRQRATHPFESPFGRKNNVAEGRKQQQQQQPHTPTSKKTKDKPKRGLFQSLCDEIVPQAEGLRYKKNNSEFTRFMFPASREESTSDVTHATSVTAGSLFPRQGHDSLVSIEDDQHFIDGLVFLVGENHEKSIRNMVIRD